MGFGLQFVPCFFLLAQKGEWIFFAGSIQWTSKTLVDFIRPRGASGEKVIGTYARLGEKVWCYELYFPINYLCCLEDVCWSFFFDQKRALDSMDSI